MMTVLLVWMLTQATWAETSEKPAELPLSAFLEQVKSQHQGIQASSLASQGALLRSEEGSLILAPQVFATVQLSSDGRETVNPSIQGNKTVYSLYNLGVSQVTSFGLAAKVYYQLSYTGLVGANPSFLPLTEFHEARPAIELTQSLWRNWGGRETRAGVEALNAAAAATAHAENYKIAVSLAEAEGAYWRLALAREMVSLQRETFDRALRLKEWTDRRVKLHLADASDRLQSEAGLAVRQFDLQQAVDEEAAAARAFNSLRSVSNPHVPETLDRLSGARIRALTTPSRSADRGDIQAAREQARAAEAGARAALEKNRPTLELFAQAALNGKAAASSSAMTNSLKTDHPSVAAGIQLKAPLAFGRSSDTREGYSRDVIAAERNLDRKLFEQERDWIEVQSNFEAAKRRYDLAEKIEQLQREKYRTERERHNRGRTTTFQVLQFEQEFSLSELARLRAASEILSVHSRMKLYSSNSPIGASP